jgi:hypothetical protein
MTAGKYRILAVACGLLAVLNGLSNAQEPPAANPYTVAVYWWPNFHCDAFHQSKKFPGWTEWEIVKHGTPRFPGHAQPKVPLWGYRDEADPKEAARSIDAMADAGVGAVIFDWYRYDDDVNGGVMIERALREGFLKSPNRQRLKLALMWANHTYIDCHPFAPGSDFSRAPVWRKGEVSRAAFERHTNDAIATYFSQPNYWKIDGKPYFSIYQLKTLLAGLKTLPETRATLDGFRRRVRAAGFPGLHLNIVDWSLAPSLEIVKGQPMPGDPSRKVQTERDLLEALGADSTTWYTWVHHVMPAAKALPTSQQTPAAIAGPLSSAILMGNAKKAGIQTRDYDDWGREAIRVQIERMAALGVPFFPHVARGWDGSPRNYRSGIVVGNTPDRFKKYLIEVKALVDKHPESRRTITINSWNEWVEGSYLEPDTETGTKYLDAIREVFGPAQPDRHSTTSPRNR